MSNANVSETENPSILEQYLQYRKDCIDKEIAELDKDMLRCVQEQQPIASRMETVWNPKTLERSISDIWKTRGFTVSVFVKAIPRPLYGLQSAAVLYLLTVIAVPSGDLVEYYTENGWGEL